MYSSDQILTLGGPNSTQLCCGVIIWATFSDLNSFRWATFLHESGCVSQNTIKIGVSAQSCKTGLVYRWSYYLGDLGLSLHEGGQIITVGVA